MSSKTREMILRFVTAWLMLFAALTVIGCTRTKTILVPEGTPIQIRQPIKAKVWVFDETGERTPGIVEIPAGWWALADPGAAPGNENTGVGEKRCNSDLE